LGHYFQRFIIIYIAYYNLNFQCSLESIYVDGTLDYCAKHFYQLCSFRCYKDNVYYVALVFYLPSIQARIHLYKNDNHINYPLFKHGLQFKLTKVTVDLKTLQKGIKYRYVWFENIFGIRF